jgi:hypothetical protein
LSDHDGPIDRRDRLGLLAGLAGLMMSGVAVTMVIVVGLAVLLRRGWRIALFHTAPLAACYLLWYAVIGRSGYNTIVRSGHHLAYTFTLHATLQFVRIGLEGAYHAMGQLPGVGVLLGIMLVTGLPLAAVTRQRSGQLRELAAPTALLIGSVLFLAITATGREELGAATASHSRYIHIVAALTLPALAVAADAFVRRQRRLLPVAVLLFAVAIPRNVQVLADQERAAKPGNDETRQMIFAVAHDPLARRLSPAFHPEQGAAPWVTLGWLLDGAARGRIPKPPHVSSSDLASDRLRLSFLQQNAGTPGPGLSCRKMTVPFLVTLHTGDEIGLSRYGVRIAPKYDPHVLPFNLVFMPDGRSSWLRVLRDTGPIRVGVLNERVQTQICRRASS